MLDHTPLVLAGGHSYRRHRAPAQDGLGPRQHRPAACAPARVLLGAVRGRPGRGGGGLQRHVARGGRARGAARVQAPDDEQKLRALV